MSKNDYIFLGAFIFCVLLLFGYMAHLAPETAKYRFEGMSKCIAQYAAPSEAQIHACKEAFR